MASALAMALAEAGAVDLIKVAAWAEFFGGRSGDVAPEIRGNPRRDRRPTPGRCDRWRRSRRKGRDRCSEGDEALTKVHSERAREIDCSLPWLLRSSYSALLTDEHRQFSIALA